jgi:hypothetical protein
VFQEKKEAVAFRSAKAQMPDYCCRGSWIVIAVIEKLAYFLTFVNYFLPCPIIEPQKQMTS